VKRATLRKLMERSRLVTLRWRYLPKGLYCFNYHRIGYATSTEFDRGVFSCSPENLERHLIILRERFEIVDLNRMQFYLKHPSAVKRPLALLTFDDGYRDNWQIAFPILRRYETPAVFFIPTSFVGTEKIPWWDELAWLLRKCRKQVLRFPGTTVELRLSPDRLEDSIRLALRLARQGVGSSMEELLFRVAESSGVVRPVLSASDRLFMDWEEVRDLASAGMDIGSHTHSHEMLARLPSDVQTEELKRSKEILEGQLKKYVTVLAYPFGGRNSYTKETQRLARELGYKMAFNYVGGVNRLPILNLFEIGRLAVDGDPDDSGLRWLATWAGLGR